MALRLLYTGSAAAAAVLTIVAAFLAWASLSVTVPLLTNVSKANRYGWEGDGIITLILGVLALAFALYTWVERRPSAFLWSALFNALLGALIFATALVNLVDTERAVGAAQSKLDIGSLISSFGFEFQDFVTTETGPGVYTAIAAGLLLAVASSAAFVAGQTEPFASALASDAGIPACHQCRAELPPAAKFCPACGTRIG